MKIKQSASVAFLLSTLLLSGCNEILVGFTANQICSRHFITGESETFIKQNVINEALSGLINPQTSISDNGTTKRVTVTSRDITKTSVYREGLGCTLAMEKEAGFSADDIAQQTITPYTGIVQQDVPSQINAELSQYLADNFFNEDSTAANKKYNTFGVVVAKDGKIIAESYDAEHNASMPMLSWSMAKTITGMLTGIIIKDDAGNTTEQTEVLPAANGYGATTLKNVLNMSSGLQWVEDSNNYANDDLEPMWFLNGNSVKFARSKKKVYEPGSKFQYSTGTAQILAGFAGDKMGGNVQDIHNFIQSRFFAPLGIKGAVVEHDAAGNFRGGARVFMKPYDWVKIGQLFIDKGKWNGQQVVDSQWIEKMTAPQPGITDVYGYQLWLNHEYQVEKQSDGTLKIIKSLPAGTVSLRGYRGQYVVAIPEENIVVARFGAYGFEIGKDYEGATRKFMALVAGLSEKIKTMENNNKL